ncbi:MAG: hypothetical protein NVS9B9_31760 [Ktedonobacteraceae bacterium]
MGMYSAMMKQVHEHARKLEKSGQLEKMFQVQERKQEQKVVCRPSLKEEEGRGHLGK